MIRVWHYLEVRPKFLFLASLAAMCAALMVMSVRAAEPGLVLLLAAFQVSLYANGLDERIADADSQAFIRGLLASIAATLLVSVLAYSAWPRLSPGYSQVARLLALAALIALFSRWLLHLLVKRNRMVESLLIVGTGETAQRFYAELRQGAARSGWQRQAGISGPASAEETAQPGAAATPAVAIPGEAGVRLYSSELRQWIESRGIRRITVVEPHATRAREVAEALLDCKLRGIEIEQAVDSYERLSGKIWLEALHADWMIYSDGFRPPPFYRLLKSAVDRAGALLLLVMTSPLLALVALAIKLESPGPVLFRQLRVGRYGKNFVLYKFRSMRVDAENGDGPKWAAKADDRVTAVGRWLRKFRLDELPQVINVLRGDMSLIGPRPERPYFVKMLREQVPFYDLRMYIKPGITGWAQVYYPYGASVEDAYQKLQYDLYYAKHMSFVLDVRILLSTLRVVLFGRGR